MVAELRARSLAKKSSARPPIGRPRGSREATKQGEGEAFCLSKYTRVYPKFTLEIPIHPVGVYTLTRYSTESSHSVKLGDFLRAGIHIALLQLAVGME
jgi:hypothetical protein